MTLSLQALIARLIVLITALLSGLLGGFTLPGVTPGSGARDILLPAGVSQATYTVVEATDGAGVEQAWPDYAGGVNLSVQALTDGQLLIAIRTPCNTLNVHARAEGSALVPGEVVSTLMACGDPLRVAAETWLSLSWSPDTGTVGPGFLKSERLEVGRTTAGNVTLSSDKGTLVLAPVG